MSVSPSALGVFGALCSEEIFNQARLKAYVDNGITPNGYSLKSNGCPGLVNILPCINSEPPLPGGYQTPEQDNAPWYDPAVPESKDFAGLWVQSAEMTGPYERSVSSNLGNGSTLGRLRLPGRQIRITGWLWGRTCCATAYGLSWLSSVLGSPACDGRDCDGCDFDFLSCCPDAGDQDQCFYNVSADGSTTVYTRPDETSEWQRGNDFFRRMKGVGVIDGPTVIECKGTSCGCACGSLLRVEFTLQTSSPYIFHLAEPVLEDRALNVCPVSDDCGITWCFGDSTCSQCNNCPQPPQCLDDPFCPTPVLPPTPGAPQEVGCGCIPQQTTLTGFSITEIREWSDSTLNIEMYSGSKAARNVQIRVHQNPAGLPCDLTRWDECDACSSLVISYIPPDSTLLISGESREITITCGNVSRSAFGNVANTGGGFDWPDLSCAPICVVVETDCENTAPDATLSIDVVRRDT